MTASGFRLGALAHDVSFYPFRPPGDGHVAAAYLRSLDAPAGASLEAHIDLLPRRRRGGDRDAHPQRTRAAIVSADPAGQRESREELAGCELRRAGEAARAAAQIIVRARSGRDWAGDVFSRSGYQDIWRIWNWARWQRWPRRRGCLSATIQECRISRRRPARRASYFSDRPIRSRWRPLGAVRTLQGESMAKLTVDEVAAAIAVCQS